MKKNVEINVETILCHLGEKSEDHQGAVVPPIYQNSLFVFNSWEALYEASSSPRGQVYTRGNNPSANIVEEKIAAMANGEKAKLYSSGMGAISAAILHFVKQGDHIITINSLYGPSRTFMQIYLKEKMGIETTFISGENVKEFEDSIKKNTTLIYLESPSSLIFSLQDIGAIVVLAKKYGIKTIIDNTWGTPLFQKALDIGVDIEVHSITKYLNGHSDVVAGVAIGRRVDIDEMFGLESGLLGAKISPFEAWLIMRGLRTLPIRLKTHQESAKKIAKWLELHPKIAKVNYPGLDSFPQKRLMEKQMTGCSGLFSFEFKTKNIDSIKKFMKAVTLFRIGVSWGGHESLITVNGVSPHKNYTSEELEKLKIIIRISVGLENADDLIDDLSKAIEDMVE